MWTLLAAAFLAAHAETMDQATKFTFARSVRIPGKVLPAGTYWFVMANNGGNQKVVQICDADRTQVIANVMTESAEHLEPHSHTFVVLAQPASPGRPPALVTWFFPGTLIGHRFVCNEREQQRINEEKKVRLLVDENGVVSEKEVPSGN
jgi:hypothetical protein